MTESVKGRAKGWDGLIVLTDAQKESSFQMSVHLAERPVPATFSLNSATAAAQSEAAAAQPAAKDNDGARIETTQQFFSWFASIETNMEGQQEQSYRDFVSLLDQHRERCDEIIQHIDETSTLLGGLTGQHEEVAHKTNALHEACEHLLLEQTRLIESFRALDERLERFGEYETLSRKLNESSMGGEALVPLLARVDACIAYTGSHGQYKDALVYLTRFRQCLSRALDMVRKYITTTLKDATTQCFAQASVQRKGAASAAATGTTASASASLSSSQAAHPAQSGPLADLVLYYGRFRTHAPRVSPLLAELRARGESQGGVYRACLDDCRSCYLNQRHALIGPIIASRAAALQSDGTTLVNVIRVGCDALVRIARDEYDLYVHFFAQPDEHLDSLLDSLAQPFYDLFRPLIIKQNSIETLCEVCMVLHSEILSNQHTSSGVGSGGGSGSGSGGEGSAVVSTVTQMLEDVQQRLVYRVQAYLDTEVRRFKPAADDLSYPDRLLAQQRSGDGTLSDNTASTDAYAKWYPTVQRTLVCLHKLYRCVDRDVFSGIADEALAYCTASLQRASAAIVSHVDSQLFLISQLLVVRESISALHNIDFTAREQKINFSSLRDAAASLIQHRNRLFAFDRSNALLEFLLEGAPQVTLSVHDSKKEIDVLLKSVCERFIEDTIKSMIAPLSSFLTKVDAFMRVRAESKTGTGSPLRDQPFALPEKVKVMVNEAYLLLRAQSDLTHRSLSVYLSNADTEFILFRPIKSAILLQFERLCALIESPEYTDDDRLVIMCPPVEQIRLELQPSTDQP